MECVVVDNDMHPRVRCFPAVFIGAKKKERLVVDDSTAPFFFPPEGDHEE